LQCQLEPNLALECPFPSGCDVCASCGAAPSCASKCVYPGTWTPCSTTQSSIQTSASSTFNSTAPSTSPPTTAPTPSTYAVSSATPSITPSTMPSATPSQTTLQSATQPIQSTSTSISTSTSTSTSASTSSGFNVIVVTTSMEYSVPVSVSSWTQNAGSVVTLSGQALAGVAITSQSVSLSGDLVLDVSALDVYDGMTFTLINASSISGVWNHVDVSGSFSECDQFTAVVDYSQNQAVVTLQVDSVCDSANQLVAFVAALA
jgi:hypothetical protein